MRPPSRRSGIPSFIVMDVMRDANARVAAGHDVIHLEVGQPSTPAPAVVREAAARALATDRLGYTDALGLPALRVRIARHYGERYGIDLDPSRVIVTAGSSAAFLLAFLAAFDPGDRLLVGLPGYPAYRHIPAATGIEVVPLALDAADRFQLAAAHLEAAARTADGSAEGSAEGAIGGSAEGAVQGAIVASPANPTGSMLAPDELAALVAVAADRNLRLISDEIYHGIGYGRPEATALAFGSEPIVVNSFSKYYSMTGWRLGWLIVPDNLVRPIECLTQNLYIAPASLSQHAALAAFDAGDELEANVARYAANRRLLLDALPRLGVDRIAPADGAFYLYVDIGHLSRDGAGFARRLLAETGVAVTPGNDFDPVAGGHFLRLSYAGATAEIAEAIRRFAAWGGFTLR
ncbi:MAG: aminotransferase class I/II-fold pyridoxal phosphate-dependent enzyme [Rhodospirillales bacterium]